MTGPKLELLQRLVGEDLDSVVFVRDYVQLTFNGPRLTCWVWPRLTIDGVVHTMGDSGYRDRLCSFISRAPTDTADEPGVDIVLRFGADAITINPHRPRSSRSP